MTKKTVVILLVILAVASFFRLYHLNSIPPGLYPDEAINGNEALSDPGKIFYPQNNGREGLFINLLGVSFHIFGISIWALRVVPAILGILTVIGLYFLTEELFKSLSSKLQLLNSKIIALVSAFFLSVSFWHVNFSRIGFRGILVPLILVFWGLFLVKGFKKQNWKYLMVSGIVFGLGFYTYIPFRLAVILLFLVLGIWGLIYYAKNRLKKFILLSFLALFATFIVASPLGIYFLQHPGHFVKRATGVSIFSQNQPIQAGAKSLVSHLLMFNLKGDFNWRHNISGKPLLLWPVGIVFLIGLFYSVIQSIISLKYKKYSSLFPFCFLLSWWFVMLLPGILTIEGIPHSLRCIGAIPPVFILASLGAVFLFKNLNEIIRFEGKRYLTGLILLILIVVSLGYAQYHRYFINWGQNPTVKGAFTHRLVKIGRYLNSLSSGKKYVIVNQAGTPVPYPNGLPMPAQTPMFLERTKFKEPQSTYIKPENIGEIKPAPFLTIVPLRYQKGIFQNLKQQFPSGKTQKQNDIWVFWIR